MFVQAPQVPKHFIPVTELHQRSFFVQPSEPLAIHPLHPFQPLLTTLIFHPLQFHQTHWPFIKLQQFAPAHLARVEAPMVGGTSFLRPVQMAV